MEQARETGTSPSASSRDDDAAALREHLATRDVACPSCGYNLRGLAGGACPECNQEIALRVALVEPRIGLFLVGVVGWALGAGFSSLLMVYAVVMLGLDGGSSLPDGFFTILLGGAVVQGGAVAAMLARNRPIRRWSLWPRVWLAVLGFAASLANVLIFATRIR